jgi:chromosome segregation protein
MSIDRFKSFKHASLLFNKGFNCIVGPNASGKSNICDALLFSLGESSLRRLRVPRLDQLINATAGRKISSLAKAHVKLEFVGDERIELSRGVRADGKTVYRLNGKRMTRQEALEVLKKHHVHVDETSTIAQGEINNLINLNPKQRRELIDIAAGIKEFDHKKAEALSELEKVSIKISTAQATLNERLGFLKELEKEKEAAETYLKFSKRIKELNYSILTKRKGAVHGSLEDYAKEISKLEEKKKSIEEKISGSAKKITELSEERQKITKVLSDSSDALTGTNSKLAETEKELNALEVKLGTGNATINDSEKLMVSLEEEIKKTQERISGNETEIGSLKDGISRLEAETERLSSSQGISEVIAGKKIKDLSSSLQYLEKETTELQEMTSKLHSSSDLVEANRSSALKELSAVNAGIDQENESVLKSKEKERVLSAKKAYLKKMEEEMREQLIALSKAQDTIDAELIELKQQRALSRGRDNLVYDRLKSSFNRQSGFYGAVAELCSYEPEYAEAIEAAAGAHFGYIVVESIDAANAMIQYLKKNGLGRATFIPLQELNVNEEKKEKDLKAVNDLLTFDSKFEKVFTYLFNNTYLVDDVEEAKKLGIGRHRYVTISGETVERSGILTGGSRAKFVSIASIDKQLGELESTKSKIANEIKQTNETAFSTRKETALIEMEETSLNVLMQESSKRLKLHEENKLNLESELNESENEMRSIKESEAAAKKESDRKMSELAKTRQELQLAYDENLRESVEAARNGMKKEQLEGLERARKELEETRIRYAEMQKENKMLESSKNEVAAKLKDKKELIAKTRKETEADLKRKMELNAHKEKVDEELRNSSKHTKELYGKLDAINTELDSLNKEQGAANTRFENMSKQINEIMVKKGQMEVRFNDITAELSAYGDANIGLIEGDAEEMEKEVGVMNAKITSLGNVNLKAPEVYEEKAKSAADASEKVNTLETEKRSVLSMIEELDSKKLNAFIYTFNEVNKNFAKLYNYIFPESAHIELENMNAPLESGLDIKIEDGKGFKRLSLLSGGEKSLISLMLIFSIHMCKPSSVYLFDEIDSALDKENSKKLSQLMKEMSKDAQFIVVSHNDSLIVNADAAIGVIKADGESKVVGIEISNIRNK